MKTSDSKKQIRFGAIISYVSIGINVILTLLYTPWMIGRIGQSNYALYTLSISLISIFVLDFGIGASVARFIAKYRAEGEEEKVAQFLGIVYKLFFTIAVCVGTVLLVLYFFLDNIYVGLTKEELDTFKTLYIVVSSYSVFSLIFIPLDGILNAYERFVFVKLVGLLQKLLSVCFVVLPLLLGYGLIFVVLANVVSGFLAILIKAFFVFRNKKLRPILSFRDKNVFKSIFAFSIWITVISIAQRCMFNLAPSILGVVSNSKEIAIFSPANNFESYYYIFASAINGLFLPRVSRYIAENKKEKILELMIKVGRFQIALLGLIFVGFAIVGRDFMLLWLGDEYKISYFAAIILFIPDLLMFSQQIANTYMIASGKVRLQAIGYIIMAVVCLSLSFPFSYYLGCVGACIAIAVGYLCNFIYINFIYYFVMKIDLKKFFIEAYLKPLILVVILSVTGIVVMQFVSIESWIVLILVSFGITIVYLVLTFLIVLTKEEKNRIIRVFRRKNENLCKTKNEK